MLDDSNEVQELMSRSYTTPDYIDDADLEAGNLLNFYWDEMRCTNVMNFRIRNVGN